jgi:hypothetical protein
VPWPGSSVIGVRSSPSGARFRARRRRPDRELFRGGSIPSESELATGRVELALRQGLDRVASLYWRGAARLI